MLKPLWLVRPRPDGGCDYVSFQCDPVSGSGPSGSAPPGSALPRSVEMREGSHLPPQMPLLKRRHRLDPDEAERWRLQLEQEGGFRFSEPLF